ncbi:hypothetical protein A0128_19715 [Leptospira tipperaryensis]|uniref:Uncharacterized protein n=1 Tax=Leptospira tipperaryensis TaxID=2564040 RepID=A0A1D7V365_9LEPT|nr:hypothetical protein A0128_19715 [Leptospira tipperaryensis]
MTRNELNKILLRILKAYEEMRTKSSLNGSSEVLEANREIGKILKSAEERSTEQERWSGSWLKLISKELRNRNQSGFFGCANQNFNSNS